MSRSVLRRSKFTGLAAAAAVAMSLVSAGGAQAAPVRCTIKSFTPAKFVIAATDTTQKFSVKTTGCTQQDWQIDWTGPTQMFAAKSLPLVTFDPTLLQNSLARKYKMKVTVTSTTNTKTSKYLYMTLARRSTFGSTFNMSPEPTTAGSSLKVVGTLKRVSWDSTPSYVAYSKRKVQLQFKAAGAKTIVNKKTLTTDASGKVKATVKVSKTGTWRLHFAGNSITGAADSTTDAITVRS
jgi:hypothetical protein